MLCHWIMSPSKLWSYSLVTDIKCAPLEATLLLAFIAYTLFLAGLMAVGTSRNIPLNSLRVVGQLTQTGLSLSIQERGSSNGGKHETYSYSSAAVPRLDRR